MRNILKYTSLFLLGVFAIGCAGSESNGTNEDLDGDIYLELVASSNFVISGGESAISFSVMANQKEISDLSLCSIFYVSHSGDVELESATYDIDQVGEYIFYATYKEVQSAQITVKGISALPDAAPDAAPDKFDSFRKHALGLLATGTDCPNCYKLLGPVHDYLETETTGDLIMTEVHEYPLDPMRCEASYWMDKRMGRLGFPTLRFNLSGKPEYYIDSSRPANADSVAEVVEYIMSTPAQTAISANTLLEGDVLHIRADVKIAIEGEYKIGAMIIEDGIYAPQVSALGEYMNTHNGVLCGAYPLNMAMCEKISNTKYQAAKSNHIFYCEFDLNSLTSLQKRENCRVVIYVYNNYDLVVDNVIQFPMGASYPMVYTDL